MIENLKLLRKEKGISQQQLADIIGVTQQSINKYENHKIEPDIDTLIKLAVFFDTSVDYLVGHSSIRHVIEDVRRYDLNSDEIRLVEGYRLLSKTQKETLQQVIEAFHK